MSVLKPGELEFVVPSQGDEPAQRFILTLKTRGLIALQRRFTAGDAIASTQEIFEKAASGSLEHVVAIMWASFQKYHPEVTVDQVIDMVDIIGLEALDRQLQSLSDSTTPDPADVKELSAGNPQKAQARRGPGARSKSRPSASV